MDLGILHPIIEVGEATLRSYNIWLPSLMQMIRPHEPLRPWQHASVSAHNKHRGDRVHLE